MDTLADEYADREVGGIFLYTNEAHPGEILPHHTSMEQKAAQAEKLREVYGVRRPILLDELEGACHRRYGSMPNMTWIFDRRGIVLYKSDWSDAGSVKEQLDLLMGLGERRRAGQRISPYRVERMEYREIDRDGFYQGLELAGPKAVEEFRNEFGE